MSSSAGELRRNNSASNKTSGSVKRAMQKNNPREAESSQVSWYALDARTGGYSVKFADDDEQTHHKSTRPVVEGTRKSRRHEHVFQQRR